MRLRPPSCATSCFELISLFLTLAPDAGLTPAASTAYIIGTMTLVVVRGDERTREYREKMAGVQQYSEHHAVPHTLRESMRQHVELHFQVRSASACVLAMGWGQGACCVQRGLVRRLADGTQGLP